jgi:hypothetical protein
MSKKNNSNGKVDIRFLILTVLFTIPLFLQIILGYRVTYNRMYDDNRLNNIRSKNEIRLGIKSNRKDNSEALENHRLIDILEKKTGHSFNSNIFSNKKNIRQQKITKLKSYYNDMYDNNIPNDILNNIPSMILASERYNNNNSNIHKKKPVKMTRSEIANAKFINLIINDRYPK